MAIYYRCDRCGGEINYRGVTQEQIKAREADGSLGGFMASILGVYGSGKAAAAEAGDFRLVISAERLCPNGDDPAPAGSRRTGSACDLCRDCIHEVIDGKLREGV